MDFCTQKAIKILQPYWQALFDIGRVGPQNQRKPDKFKQRVLISEYQGNPAFGDYRYGEEDSIGQNTKRKGLLIF